ncbi:hypothetical protein NC652_011989 [Populus alba x Populus x berolinensis]|nr:hypothetical protein NC652_011989 [Populus alba x Populus x berolinensis]
MVEQEIDRRRTSPEKYHRRVLLSQVLEDMDEDKFLNEDMTIHLVLSVLIVKGESISTSLTLVFRAPCRRSISASRADSMQICVSMTCTQQLQWCSPTWFHGLASHWRDPSFDHSKLFSRPSSVHQEEDSKDREKATKFLKDKLEERRNSPDMYRGDLLDQVTADLNKEDKEKFLSDDFIITVIFGLLFAGFESAEHEGILKNRRNSDPVINESLRLGNVAPGLLRRALKDIEFKGFTIPAGWIIMAVTSASHLNPDVYKDPLAFNAARWKDMDAYLVFKNFMAFSGGTRQGAGAEFSKLLMATFLHVLLAKYEHDHVAASAQVFVAGLLMAFLDLNFLITDGPESREDELFESRFLQKAQLSVSDGTRLKRENDGKKDGDDIC